MRLSRGVRGVERRIRVERIGPVSCNFCGYEPKGIRITLGREPHHQSLILCERCGRERMSVGERPAKGRGGAGTCVVCAMRVTALRWYRNPISGQVLPPQLCLVDAYQALQLVETLLNGLDDAIDWAKEVVA